LEDLVEFAVDFVQGLRVDYAEVRFQSDTRETMMLKRGSLEACMREESKGISVRVLVGGSLGFASTNVLTKRSAKKAAEWTCTLAQAASKISQGGVSMAKGELGNEKVELKPRIRFGNIDLESKAQLLKEADEQTEAAAAETGAKIADRVLTLDTWTTEKTVITTDGAKVSSCIPRAAIHILLTAYHPQKGSVQRSFDLGGTGGWETVEEWNLTQLLGAEARSLSKILLEAKKTPRREADLVLGPEVVGIVCHESSGHPGEADRILGREAAQAGETYLKADSVGLRVGSRCVNVVDDPTVKGSFGFYKYDEEGVKARKRTLIKEGVINEFLHNRETASVFGVESNGSSRAVAYNREPIVRMANTFLEPGDHSQEELFEDIKEGVYIKNFMEWNIDDRRFNQRYVGLEAYRIEDGELKDMLRNPVLEVTTVGLWSAVDAVGGDPQFQAAYCGKGDPMQAIPVWTGGPHVRLRKVRLGGA